MTENELNQPADDWIAYWLAPKDTALSAGAVEATSTEFDLYEEDPETLWRLILLIHSTDQSTRIPEVLSAGPIENLLTRYGEQFIARVQAEARRDPSFARVLGGVWQSDMSDSVWAKLQAVWDRRGWDGIPE